MPTHSRFTSIVKLPSAPYEPALTPYNCLRHYTIQVTMPGITKLRIKALRVPTLFPQQRCLGGLRALLENKFHLIQQHRHIASTNFCEAFECGPEPKTIAPPIVLVMREYAGNILDYIDKFSGLGASVAQRTRWLLQTASALKYLHELDIIHGNFYFGNVLIDWEGAAVVADAGIYTAITKHLVPDEVANDLKLPNSLSCKSAEAVLKKGSRWVDPTMSDDVFGFVATTWTVYSGREPFPMYGETSRSVFRIGERAHRELQQVGGMSDGLWSQVSIILAQDRRPWPSLAEIISELKTIDFQ